MSVSEQVDGEPYKHLFYQQTFNLRQAEMYAENGSSTSASSSSESESDSDTETDPEAAEHEEEVYVGMD